VADQHSVAAQQVRRLTEYRAGHPVISLYMDLHPGEFATGPARSTEIHSLVDEAHRKIEAQDGMSHDDRITLREDLKRVEAFLSSPEAPYRGARALAVFCSGQDDLFEVLQLLRPTERCVVIARKPFVDPLVDALEERRWLVALVNRREGRVLEGSADALEEQARLEDFIRGQSEGGGWSQANYERSIEKDTEDHLRRVAQAVNELWRTERFHRVAVGGPAEIVPRFESHLTSEVRSKLAPERVDVDLSSATGQDVRSAVARLVLDDAKRSEREALDHLGAGIGTGGRGVGGPEGTVAALNERRVGTLLLEPGFDRPGARCTSCGLLMAESDGHCPADGSPTEEVEHLREAIVESALAQDAEVMIVRHYPDLGPWQGIGALLRF
jgi:peptide chain release factor subunit 1